MADWGGAFLQERRDAQTVKPIQQDAVRKPQSPDNGLDGVPV